jgi:hypothetical protein
MSDKTIEKLEDELRRRDLKDAILKEGDDRWASKLTEIIVYGLCGLILTGAIVAILSVIYK